MSRKRALMLDGLREDVLAANRALPEHGLVVLTSGNVSGIDRDQGLVVIKPSGVFYDALTVDDMVVVDLDGNVVQGDGRPSTDTPTHLVLYRALPAIGGVVHTHSTWATAWAQAQREIPLLGTTHADLCAHPIPVTRPLSPTRSIPTTRRATGDALVEAVVRAGRGGAAGGAGPRTRAVLLGSRRGRGGEDRGFAGRGCAGGAADHAA